MTFKSQTPGQSIPRQEGESDKKKTGGPGIAPGPLFKALKFRPAGKASENGAESGLELMRHRYVAPVRICIPFPSSASGTQFGFFQVLASEEVAVP